MTKARTAVGPSASQGDPMSSSTDRELRAGSEPLRPAPEARTVRTWLTPACDILTSGSLRDRSIQRTLALRAPVFDLEIP